jgi:hypothetical protein
MAQETMSRQERIDTVLAFGKPDRVPVVPLFVKSTALSHCGVGQGAGAKDHELSLRCMLQMFDDVGGWDALYIDVPDTAVMQVTLWQQPVRFKIPGIDLPEDAALQVDESEVMTVADYDRVIEEGWQNFYYDDLIHRITDMDAVSVEESIAEFVQFRAETCIPEWTKRGVTTFCGDAGGIHPFFFLSLARSLTKFIEDLYYRPELVDRALRKMTDEWIANSVAEVEAHPAKACLIAEERASAFFIPPRLFERFWWPYTAEFVDAMWSRGVVTEMHLDTDWGKNLPYFKRDLPRGSYMLQLDSTTDIFAAKEFLKGHAMFHGDVPATLQAIGTPEEVAAYCRKLIDEVGYEGGFILGTGCETPPNCGVENLRAMVETGRKYELTRT